MYIGTHARSPHNTLYIIAYQNYAKMDKRIKQNTTDMYLKVNPMQMHKNEDRQQSPPPPQKKKP